MILKLPLAVSILFSHEPRRELQKKVKWKINQIGRHLWSGLLGDLFLYAFSRLKWSILVNVILSRSSTFFHELCICTKYLWVMNGVLSSQVLLFPINWMICKWNKDCKISSSICLAVVYGSSTIHVYFLFAVFSLVFLRAGFIISSSLSRTLCRTIKLSVQNCLHRQNLTSHRDFLLWDTLLVLHFPLQEVTGGMEEFNFV